MDYKKVESCRVCKSYRLRSYLNLGSVPLCNSLQKSEYEQVEKYPIEVLFCEDCYLSQLSIVVDPKILYSDYVYHSSVSQTFKEHCYQMALTLKSEFVFTEFPLVLDIASNDGCLLREFKRAGFTRLLGFEPAKNIGTYETSYKLDELICVVNDFFCEASARSVKGDAGGGQASIITATNVFAHVDDLDDFLRGVKWFLHDNGVFVVEVPYLKHLIQKNEFDTIYHEHLSYFLLKPLVKLFERHGLPIFRVEEYPIHGGSIRIYASLNRPVESSVTDMLRDEELAGLYNIKTYEEFNRMVMHLTEGFCTMMEMFYYECKKVVAYGASAKGISLLNYCGIKNHMITCIIDDTPDKQGKLTPGSLIPIVSYPYFEAVKPDVIVLLAWNFAEELMAKTKWHKDKGGHYVIPVPELKII